MQLTFGFLKRWSGGIFMGIKQSTSVLVQTYKNVFLAKFYCKFLAFFSFFAQKMLKMTISTSIWCAQHPKAGQNKQQLSDSLHNFWMYFWLNHGHTCHQILTFKYFFSTLALFRFLLEMENLLKFFFKKFSRWRVCWFEPNFFVTRCLQQAMQNNK